MNQLLSRLTMGRAMMMGFVIGAFYYFFMFDEGVSQKSQISQRQARIQELQTQIQDNQAKLDRAAVYKKTATEVGSTINKLVSLIPEKFGMSDLMRIVADETRQAGLSQSATTPGATVISPVAPEFEELTVAVDVSGSFLQHMIFLSNLTKVPQILITRKIEFTHVRDGRGDEPPIVKMSADITAFRYRGTASSQKKGP